MRDRGIVGIRRGGSVCIVDDAVHFRGHSPQGECGLKSVRLVKPDGTPFAEGVATVSWDSITGKPSTFPAAAPAWNAITGKPSTFAPPDPTSSARGGVLQQTAEAQLAASADAAAITAKVNAMLTKLKAAGVLA